MTLCQKVLLRPALRACYHPFQTLSSTTIAGHSLTRSFRHSASRSTDEPNELFEYTTGRWVWNDAQKRSERRRVFNVPEFKRLAAAAVNQRADDVTQFRKLGEGGFNRSFLVTMRDGFEFVGRIPYLCTEPRELLVANEVATMRFLRLHGMPVPKIYAYSTTSDNAAGTECIFMELIRGTNLGDVWFDLPDKARVTIVTKLVELESRLFALDFPASGSLYYSKDLETVSRKIGVPVPESAVDDGFCIGPEASRNMWYGKRINVQTDRGPHTDVIATLTAGAKKEIAYLTNFGRPILPFQRIYRDDHNYKKQSPSGQIENLEKYLRIAPFLVPKGNNALLRPTLRHPDLNPNNVFVSDDLEITGLIDWQHSAILPLFLQCGIPDSLQNYGDSVSESLIPPRLPPNFDDLDEKQQHEELQRLQKRYLHYFYVLKTEALNPMHYDALVHENGVIRRKLFCRAGEPWEGENVTLKADLIYLVQNWEKITATESSSSSDTDAPCPIFFTEEEVSENARLEAAHVESDEMLQKCRDAIGVGSEGWVPAEMYDEVKQCERKLKAQTLEQADSEEIRARLQEHWVFDDFDEEEYK